MVAYEFMVSVIEKAKQSRNYNGQYLSKQQDKNLHPNLKESSILQRKYGKNVAYGPSSCLKM